ncbi:thiamine pyrophosphate-dependent enzyme [Rhizobium mesoamericanum]|uniref:Thiamine pyrophosphate enzyme, central domain family n=1 Tax=Rhizobium mesoamericanum STM3625 TaxID=1211777 RepID=K0Q597_9HYPH|nr:thiamine pyrophosphate-dependent enzyme [Rhizobium mesoamericanum]CCM78294.1 Thiamine pyrophosphate enzyme, central domain family [Rhizobium mesoamericanum STM3625]
MSVSTFPQGPEATASDRAKWLKSAGGLNVAVDAGRLDQPVTMPLAEALLLGLMRQGVTKYLAIFGHGSTAIADVLEAYEAEGLVRCWQFRNEIEMAHAGTALSWVYGEVAAVVTSIGPGALQAMAASLAAASNGVGVYHLYGDETTHGEGYNMQQVPKPGQGVFSQVTSLMGASYTLYSPGALRDGLRKGAAAVFHPWKAGPFFMNLPLNTQPAPVTLRLDALPVRPHFAPLAPAGNDIIEDAARQIAVAGKVAIKLGGGSRGASEAVRALTEAAGALVVTSPGAGGVLPAEHPQNMQVGGSKGSISGNWTMKEAELLVVIGSRAVCQADCSGIGWPKVKAVININADPLDVQHYNRTTALPGDASAVAHRLANALKAQALSPFKAEWLAAGAARRTEWSTFIERQVAAPAIHDTVWDKPVLTQPRAIRAAADFCCRHGAVKFFDAGDVQANGFQIVKDHAPGDTFTETGASYMGFAVSALLSSALAENGRYGIAFTGDGSFMMNPQVLIDGVEHGVHGTILLFDNRRMAAISHLQLAQYGRDFRTNDSVAVDYVQMAGAVNGVKALHGGTDEQSLVAALEEARNWKGLSLIHVPIYFGDHPAVGLGAYGQWNVGNWVESVERQYTETLI